MPTIQFYLPEDLDKKVKYFMVNNDLNDKRIAILKILRYGFHKKLKLKKI